MVILNLIFAIIAFYFAYIYAFTKQMVLKSELLEYEYKVDNNLSFMLYSILTSMLFLGPFSILKYIVWIMIIIFMMRKWHIINNKVIGIYMLFVLWSLYSLYYSADKSQGFSLIVKYLIPILYFWLGYNSINDREDFILFLSFTNKVLIIYSILIGGLMNILIPGFYNFLLWKSALFVGYAALADFYSALIVVPIALYLLTNEKKYLACAAFILLSTIIQSVRTGIAGATIATCLLLFVRFKLKSLPYLIILSILFVGSVFLIPSVKEKMFGKNARMVTIENFTSYKVESNGRENLWDANLKLFYEPQKATGAGLGTSVSFSKRKYKAIGLLHSDYIQILCDTGYIGLCIFILFGISFLLHSVVATWRCNDLYLMITGGMALGSLGGITFSMAYDNVMTYSQQCYIFPFLLYGIFLKFLHNNSLH